MFKKQSRNPLCVSSYLGPTATHKELLLAGAGAGLLGLGGTANAKGGPGGGVGVSMPKGNDLM